MDLSPGRLRSRWSKLRRDPAAFAADLPLPPLRSAAIASLWAATWIGRLARGRAAQLGREWRRRDVALRRGGDSFDALDADGRPPAAWPDLLEVRACGRPLVIIATSDDGDLRAAAELGANASAILALNGRAARFVIYALDGGEAPARLACRPADRAVVLKRAQRSGLDVASALQAAWPPAERRTGEPSAAAYRAWIRRNEPAAQDLEALGAAPAHGAPLISILMPVHDPRPDHLEAALASVRDQAWRHWQLCIADDGSGDVEVRRLLRAATADERVRLVRLDAARGVVAATNAALELAEGEVCLFLDHDDTLAAHALALVAAAFQAEPGLAAVYSDEDTIDNAGRRSAPLFKPKFDRERLLAHNYVNHAFAVRTAVLRRLGGLSEGLDGAQDHDLVLRVADSGAGPIRRLAHVLYHWRIYPGGESLSQVGRLRTTTARITAVSRALERQGRTAEVRADARGRLLIEAPAPGRAVAVVMPTRDRPGLLRAASAGVLRQTRWPDLRLVVVDNGSREPQTLGALSELAADARVQVQRVDAPFNFSGLCNAGAAASAGELLLFLNDDVLIAHPDWLERMVALAVLPDVGAVGAKLHYGDGRIQHAGLVLGLGPQGVAGHEFRARPGDEPGPQGRLMVAREVSAVTGACLLVERRKFDAVGGFDEALAVAFNDVDLCLRLRRAGWRNIWTPGAQLVHLESATRGRDLDPERAARLAAEAALMRDRWGALLRSDPCYNPNLTLDDESFRLAALSRAPAPWRKNP